jgi:hypothetical protein
MAWYLALSTAMKHFGLFSISRPLFLVACLLAMPFPANAEIERKSFPGTWDVLSD